jgi:hypothetical protein
VSDRHHSGQAAGVPAGTPAPEGELLAELLALLADCLELAVQTGRAVLADDVRRPRARLLSSEGLGG